MMRRQAQSAFLLAAALLGGCSSPSPDGGYYGGDRPPQHVPVDLAAIADAQPRFEPLSATGNSPYHALGKSYHPLASANGYKQRGIASWYGSKFHGRRTSSGEPYDMFAMTAAHPRLPLPTYVRVTNLDNGNAVVVKVNDRGPFLHNRIIDLSYAAAYKLDITRRGTGRVEIRAIDRAPPPEPPPPVTAPPTGAPGMVLQVGAYANRGNANDMRQRLQRAGYRVAPLSAPLTDSADSADSARRQQAAVYRVQVGPFTSHRAAQATQQKLEAMLGYAVARIMQPHTADATAHSAIFSKK